MIGKKFKLVEARRNPWELYSFLGIPVGVGSVVTVLEVEICNFNQSITGVVKIGIDESEFKISKDHPYSWAFFTDNMAEDVDEFGFLELKSTENTDIGSRTVESMNQSGSVKKPTEVGNLLVTKPLEDRYNDWILENIHVYELFCKFTLQAIESGKKKISHWLIVNRLRWEVEIETNGLCEEDKDYKISNDYIAFLARDFIKDHPQHSEIFNLKQMKRV